MTEMANAKGSCLCGSVKYEVKGPLRPVIFCHCQQCRKTSGHFVAATACLTENLVLHSELDLRWFRSSTEAERGFCATCGSSLFWRPDHGTYVSIMAGTLAHPTKLEAERHIFVADASDYYSIEDGLPQHQHDHISVLNPPTL